MAKLIDPEFELPPLSNVVKQPVGSNACGNYMLHYIEQELRIFTGELPSVWPLQGWKDWTSRLSTMVPKLEAEAAALSKKLHAEHDSLMAQKSVNAKALKKAEDTLAKLKSLTSMAYITAQESVKKNSVKFTWKDLSPESTQKVFLLKDAFGKCSRCRWQSGCLSCDAYKCLRHYLYLEAAEAKKLPYLTTGPGFMHFFLNLVFFLSLVFFSV